MPYRVEYAKTSRAGCQSPNCKKAAVKIEKGGLKLGSWIEINDKQWWSYRHWGCVTPAQVGNVAKDIDGEAEELDGFEDLNEEDQERIRKALANGHIADEDCINIDPAMNRPGAEQEAKEAEKARKQQEKEAEKARKKEEKEAEKEKKKQEKEAEKQRKRQEKAEEKEAKQQEKKAQKENTKKSKLKKEAEDEKTNISKAKPKKGKVKKEDSDDDMDGEPENLVANAKVNGSHAVAKAELEEEASEDQKESKTANKTRSTRARSGDTVNASARVLASAKRGRKKVDVDPDLATSSPSEPPTKKRQSRKRKAGD